MERNQIGPELSPSERQSALNALAPEDSAFLADFEALRVPASTFSHRQHVRLAWTLLRVDPTGAFDRVESGIRRFAAHHDAAAKYHVTITKAWMRLVQAALTVSPPADGDRFDAWIPSAPELLDPGRLRRHYSDARLTSDEARATFLEPDLQPLGLGRREND